MCPDLRKVESGHDVAYTDICDARKIIGNTVGMKPDDVIDRFWHLMTVDNILERSKYDEQGEEKYEVVELFRQIISLVN